LTISLKQAIKDEAGRLGFSLAGFTTPEAPPHAAVFENWIAQGRHGAMQYLAREKSVASRADPRQVLPGCKSILVLASPYPNPNTVQPDPGAADTHGRIAAYAWGQDYHLVLPERLRRLSAFIETQAGVPVSSRWYTDTGPVLERDLAQRAGLGWIGKNTCLIHPRQGSYFLLAEIFLDLDIEPDPSFITDHCGTCTRCLQACPTQCILPDRTLDARRCISYLTIELKDDIPPDLRPLMGEWVFGCDVCQQVCPWNRFARDQGEPAFDARPGIPLPVLSRELSLTPADFNRKFKASPVQRAKRRGYLRNVAVALGNRRDRRDRPALESALQDAEPLVREHAAWAIEQIK